MRYARRRSSLDWTSWPWVVVVAHVGLAPDLQVEVGERHGLALGRGEEAHVVGQHDPLVDRANQEWVVVTGQHHDRYRQAAQLVHHRLAHGLVDPVVVEEVADDHHGVDLVGQRQVHEGADCVLAGEGVADVHIRGVQDAYRRRRPRCCAHGWRLTAAS
jgi:hypothetical protein